jgi:hypothetical protein
MIYIDLSKKLNKLTLFTVLILYGMSAFIDPTIHQIVMCNAAYPPTIGQLALADQRAAELINSSPNVESLGINTIIAIRYGAKYERLDLLKHIAQLPRLTSLTQIKDVLLETGSMAIYEKKINLFAALVEICMKSRDHVMQDCMLAFAMKYLEREQNDEAADITCHMFEVASNPDETMWILDWQMHNLRRMGLRYEYIEKILDRVEGTGTVVLRSDQSITFKIVSRWINDAIQTGNMNDLRSIMARVRNPEAAFESRYIYMERPNQVLTELWARKNPNSESINFHTGQWGYNPTSHLEHIAALVPAPVALKQGGGNFNEVANLNWHSHMGFMDPTTLTRVPRHMFDRRENFHMALRNGLIAHVQHIDDLVRIVIAYLPHWL